MTTFDPAGPPPERPLPPPPPGSISQPSGAAPSPPSGESNGARRAVLLVVAGLVVVLVVALIVTKPWNSGGGPAAEPCPLESQDYNEEWFEQVRREAPELDVDRMFYIEGVDLTLEGLCRGETVRGWASFEYYIENGDDRVRVRVFDDAAELCDTHSGSFAFCNPHLDVEEVAAEPFFDAGAEQGVVGMACGSQDFCAVVTGNGRLHVYDDGRWSETPYEDLELGNLEADRVAASLSCWTSGCLAVIERYDDGMGLESRELTVLDGGAWTVVDPGFSPRRFRCAKAAFDCAAEAVDDTGGSALVRVRPADGGDGINTDETDTLPDPNANLRGTVWHDDTSWVRVDRQALTTDPITDPPASECVSDTFCFGFESLTHGRQIAEVNDDGYWRSILIPDDAGSLALADCVGPQRCLAMHAEEHEAYVYTWAPDGVGGVVVNDPVLSLPRSGAIAILDCARDGFCVFSDGTRILGAELGDVLTVDE